MTNTIDLITIETTFKDCFEKAAGIIQTRSWKLLPLFISLDIHKSSYGRALGNGQIFINPAFIGTKAINKLISTINH